MSENTISGAELAETLNEELAIEDVAVEDVAGITLSPDSIIAVFSADGTFAGFASVSEATVSEGFTVSADPTPKVIRAMGDALTDHGKEAKIVASMAADLAAETKLRERLAKIEAANAAKRAKVAKLRGELDEAVGDLHAGNVETAKALAGEETVTGDASE